AGWKPARSAMRSVDSDEKRHTEPSAANGTDTRLVVVARARGLRLEAKGWALSHAYAVMKPSPSLFTAVRFSSALVASLGTPAIPPTCTFVTEPAAGRAPARVSNKRVGVVDTSSGARGG